jgi:energy-coupling factor transporter ATP-binding protein EcfA2
LNDSIWISFTIFDSLNEESFIGEVYFYYEPKLEDKVDEIILEMKNFEISDDLKEENAQSNVFSMLIGQSGYEIEPINLDKEKLENIEFFYNDTVIKKVDKLSKKIKKSDKGLSIIYGERGTGKTSMVNYLSNSLKDKSFLFIPTTLFDSSINNSEFRNFIKKHKNTIIVLDDCEIYFSDLYSKSNIFTNNLLQLVDGLDSDDLGLHLLLILNCGKENDIDSHLFESNNLLDIINIDYLKKEKITELCKFLDKKNKFRTPTKLVSVIKNKPIFGYNSEIGFN